MNKIILIGLLAAAGVFPMSAQESADTVKVIENARNIVITKEGDKTTVVAVYENNDGQPLYFRYDVEVNNASGHDSDFPDNWGMDLPFIRTQCKDFYDNDYGSRTYRYVTGFRHLYWGWRFNYKGNDNVRNCFEVGIRDLLGVSWRRRGAELELGLGVGVKRFLTNDGYAYQKNGDKMMTVAVGNDMTVRHSTLDVWSFHVPLLYNQKMGNHFKFTIGGVVNFNTYATASTEFGTDKKHNKINYKGLQQNLLTVDALMALNLRGIGLYASWSPMKLFKNEYGTALRAWSLGIDFDF